MLFQFIPDSINYCGRSIKRGASRKSPVTSLKKLILKENGRSYTHCVLYEFDSLYIMDLFCRKDSTPSFEFACSILRTL